MEGVGKELGEKWMMLLASCCPTQQASSILHPSASPPPSRSVSLLLWCTGTSGSFAPFLPASPKAPLLFPFPSFPVSLPLQRPSALISHGLDKNPGHKRGEDSLPVLDHCSADSGGEVPQDIGCGRARWCWQGHVRMSTPMDPVVHARMTLTYLKYNSRVY